VLAITWETLDHLSVLIAAVLALPTVACAALAARFAKQAILEARIQVVGFETACAAPLGVSAPGGSGLGAGQERNRELTRSATERSRPVPGRLR